MSKITITIEIQEMNNPDWKVIDILPDDYFDYDYIDDDLSWESVPQYNEIFEYLSVERNSIQATKLTINDEINKVTRKIYESFWNGGNNRLIEIIDEGLNISWHELILEVLLSKNPNVTQIFRCHKKNGIFKLGLLSLITENSDGSETEKQLF